MSDIKANTGEKDIHDKIIIGAGAAGLMAAYSACKICSDAGDFPDILVLEGKDVIGKKLSATGNGKCNFTNLYQDISCYRSSESEKAFRIIKSFDNKKTIALFETIGIMSTERKGYCYPLGEQARTFRDVLKERVISLGAMIYTEKKVINVEKQDGIFVIICSDSAVFYSKKLIICTGGSAAPSFGTDGGFYKILERMGLAVLKPRPALCGLKTDNRIIKLIDGVRIKCNCCLHVQDLNNVLEEDQTVYEENGEIIFSKNGISGIPILNMSRYAVIEIDQGNKCYVSLDFFPKIGLKKLKEYLSAIVISCGDGVVGVSLSSLINDKLLKALFKELSILYYASAKMYDVRTLRNEIKKLAERLKDFRLNITGASGFENAQTTQGGVILKEIDEKTMESNKYPGMYLAGEVLDVDGMCGGYNLQWAWTTGYIAGRN